MKLILEQESLDLVVIDADGNDDGAKGAIVGCEVAADFLGGAVQAANGEEGVDAGADQECEKPAEGDEKEAAQLSGMPLGFRIVIARRSRWRGRGVFGRSRHTLKNMPKLGEKRGAKAPYLQAVKGPLARPWA